MNVERLLVDTLADHEDLAPDPDAVWAGVQRDLGRHRSLVRPLAVAASVLVVAGSAVAVTALTAPDGTSQRGASVASRPAASTTATGRAGLTPLTMPFDLGWLPRGDVSYLARRIKIGQAASSGPAVPDGEYLMAIKTADGPIDVDVQQMPGGLDGARFKCGGTRSVTIGGRRGVESANAGGRCGYEVYFRDSAGGTAYVNVAIPDAATGPAKKLTGIGRRVAAAVTFPGHSTVVPSFGVGYRPPGLRVTSFDVGTDGATMYTLGTDGLDPTVDVGTNFGAFDGTAGRSVQGHPTRYVDVHGRRMVSVLGAVHGTAIGIAGSVSRSELYRIADGLVLP